MFIKTQPDITYLEFLELVKPLQSFRSINGRLYEVLLIEGSIIKFIRKATDKKWDMDLKGVHQAYLELSDFKTENFRPYVYRKHSPALGLLLSTGLLKKQKV